MREGLRQAEMNVELVGPSDNRSRSRGNMHGSPKSHYSGTLSDRLIHGDRFITNDPRKLENICNRMVLSKTKTDDEEIKTANGRRLKSQKAQPSQQGRQQTRNPQLNGLQTHSSGRKSNSSEPVMTIRSQRTLEER